ncbi:hypothetical protein HMI56_006670 [Coelomomyces lativittatus]|nr:hypothetical protein HMI56_006670 [Coelomomyces lativittatus]
MLVRSGIQKIRVIDFDQVTLSSLNRHAVATHADVGTSKVHCLQKYLRFIAPQAEIEPICTLFNEASATTLLANNPDFVLDCIDNLPSKVQLIHYCYTHRIPLISSMGSGSKCDPTRIRISDISETISDPLARAVRGALRKLNITHGINVVYSSEIAQTPLIKAKGDNPEDFAPLPNFRSSILPVLGTLPALFGITMVTHVLNKLVEWPSYSPLPRHHLSLNSCTKMLKDLQPSILRVADVFFLVEEIWHGRSLISGKVDSLVLVPWDPNMPVSLQNCVLMTKEEALVHKDKFSSYNKSVYDRVNSGIALITSLQASYQL